MDKHKIQEKANKKIEKAMTLMRRNRKLTLLTAVGFATITASAVSSFLTLHLVNKKTEEASRETARRRLEEITKTTSRPSLPAKYEEQKKQNEEAEKKKEPSTPAKPKTSTEPKNSTKSKSSSSTKPAPKKKTTTTATKTKTATKPKTKKANSSSK